MRNEMGEAMGNVLSKEEHENKIYNFTGFQKYSCYDIAAALIKLSAKEVTYTNVETDRFKELMLQRNLPMPIIQKITDFIADIRNNQEAEIYPDLEMALGRKPAGLKDGLKLLFGL